MDDDTINQFCQELLREIDEFCAERSTTIEEARGADAVAEIIRRLQIATNKADRYRT